MLICLQGVMVAAAYRLFFAQKKWMVMTIRVVKNVSELLGLREEWDELSKNAIEKNVFYDSWMLIPALRHFASKNVFVVFVYGTNGKLIGLFPFKRNFFYRRVPLPHLALWRYPHAFLCAPLMHREFSFECFYNLLVWLKRHSSQGLWLDLQDVYSGAAVHSILGDTLKGEVATLSFYKRGILRCVKSSKEYFASPDFLKTAKKSKRCLNLLSNKGSLEFVNLGKEQEKIGEWIKSYLALEASGWKGRQGTALSCDARDQGFFSEAMQAGYSKQALISNRLELNGEVIAMQWLLVAGQQGFGFKTAYNEKYAAFSPGIALAYKNTEFLLDQSKLLTVDSCSAAGQTHASFWKESRKVARIIVNFNKSFVSKIIFSLASAKKRFTTAMPETGL